jgi:hypothetical protein
MKKTFFLLMAIVVFSTICNAQNGIIGIRGAGGLILDEPMPGIAAAFDLKLGKAPLVFSPYVQYYASDGLGKAYFGANVQFEKHLSKGFYFGVGGGLASWSYDGDSRVSPSFSPLLGIKIRLTNKLSLFGEAKMFINTKTNQDTEDFNNGVEIIGPLFDNDFTAIVGLSFVIF